MENKAKFGNQVLERIVVDGSTLVGMTLVNIIIARALGASGKGAIALVMLTANIIFVFTSFGVHQANNYFRGRRNENPNTLYANAIVFSLAISILASGIFLAVYPLISGRFFSGLPVSFIVLALGITPFLHLQSSFVNFLLIANKHRYYNVVSFLKIFLNLGLVYLFLFPLHLGIHSALVAWVSAQVFLALAIVFKVWSVEHITFIPRISVFRQTFLFGLKGYFGNFIYFINQRLDMIMVSFFLPLSDVGVYSVASALSEVLLQLPGSVTTLLFPRVAATSDEESNDFTPRIFRSMVLIMIVLALVLALLGKVVITYFFGTAFEAAITPLYIMLPGVACIGASTVLGNDMSARGRLEIHSYISGIGLAADIILNIFLIPRLGLIGAALGSSLSYILITIAVVIAFRVVTKVSYSALFIPRKGDFIYYMHILNRLHMLPKRFKAKIS